MADEQHLVLDAAERLFADLADAQSILLLGRARDWKTPLWRALEEMGLPRAWLPEDLDGHGLSMREGFAVVHAAGKAALAVPLVETMVAGWIAGKAGLSLPAGASTLIIAGQLADVQCGDDNALSVQARRVPFARDAQAILVIADRPAGARVSIVPTSDCHIEAGVNLAGDASDSVRIDTRKAKQVDTTKVSIEQALYLAATCRSLQIAGALQAALDLSVAYSKERVAFEKPIAKFQAVQQNLARLAGEVAAAVAASDSAADTLSHPDTPAQERLLEVASAKVRSGEAAEIGAGIAHQVLGAIGFTEAHALHRFTLRALAWRDDFGTEMVWARRLGDSVSQGSSADLWQLLSAR